MRPTAVVVRRAPRGALGRRRRDIALEPRAAVPAAPEDGARRLCGRDDGGTTDVLQVGWKGDRGSGPSLMMNVTTASNPVVRRPSPEPDQGCSRTSTGGSLR